MRKKILMFIFAICLIIPSVFMFVGCNKDNDKVLKTELNGVIYESNSFYISTYLEQKDEDDYVLSLKGELNLSVYNTTSTPFTFQVGSIDFQAGDFPFNFHSLKDTSNSFYTEENTDAVTISANTQTVLKIEYRYTESSLRAADLETLKEEINLELDRLSKNYEIQSKYYSFEVNFLTTRIIKSRIFVEIHSAQQLIDWYL